MMSRLKPRSFLVLVTLLFAVFAYAVPTLADDDDPDRPIVHRGDRYIPKAAGTKENLRFWFGPFLIPPGSDANRVNADLPLANGFITNITPKLRNVADLTEPSHQAAHIHHAHWFALDPGNKEDNYTYGNTEWIFGNGDEETKAEFDKRSDADPNGPIYGQYVGAQGPQLMIYMIHNKTSAPLNVYVVLDVTFIHGTKEELAGGKRPYHDLTGVLFGRTFDVPRKADGDGTFDTTHDMPKQGPIEWTSTIEGTIVGTGSHVHPGGTEVLVENLGSKESPCPNDGRGTGGTLPMSTRTSRWRSPTPRSARRSTRATSCGSPASMRTRTTPGTRR